MSGEEPSEAPLSSGVGRSRVWLPVRRASPPAPPPPPPPARGLPLEAVMVVSSLLLPAQRVLALVRDCADGEGNLAWSDRARDAGDACAWLEEGGAKAWGAVEDVVAAAGAVC